MIQSESESVVGLVVVISIIVALGLLQVRNVRHDRRLRRLYAEADIRMVGGPFDGATLDPVRGGHEWPPKSAVVFYLEEEDHFVRHVYVRTDDGDYHLSKTLPPVKGILPGFPLGGPQGLRKPGPLERRPPPSFGGGRLLV